MSLELLEEIEVLKSIYGEENIIAENLNTYWSLTYIDSLLDIQLSLNILLDYPINNSETLIIQTLNSSSPISSRSIQEILLQISKNHPNETILFQILECIKEFCCGNEPSSFETFDETETLDFDNLQIIQDLQFDPPISNNENDHIIHGPPFSEMKSTFQAHIAPVSSMDEVKAFRSKVLEDKKVYTTSQNYIKQIFILYFNRLLVLHTIFSLIDLLVQKQESFIMITTTMEKLLLAVG